MLKRLVASSLEHRGATIALAALIMGYGLYRAASAKLDVFPEIAPPQVTIHTEAPGLSPEEVESLVTRPVENGVSGTGDMSSVRSQSIQGISVVTAVFREGTDVLAARQRVSERLGQILEQLPAGARAPVLAPLTSSTSLVLTVGLTSASRSAMDLRTIADWVVRPRLLGIPGVASVVEFGGEVRQIQVQMRPEALAAHDVSPTEVVDAARDATGLLGAGFVETESQRIAIRTEGQARTAEEIGRCLVEPGIRLVDVARVTDAPAPKIGAAAIDGVPGVLLHVWGQYGQNTLELTAAIEEVLARLAPALEAEGVAVHPRLFRPASFVEASIRNVTVSLFIGGALVAAILILFLFNARAAFISILAIPLSLLAAVIVLCELGASLNTLTLGGLAIAIGEVVDDAIIDVENIIRRLRENRRSDSPRPAMAIVLDASLEVRGAVVHATFVVVLVFLPVLTMSGVQGKLFAPLGIAYILAILASLLVALTVTPALSLVLLAAGAPREEPSYLAWIKRLHHRLLLPFTRHHGRVMAGTLVLCAAAACALPFLGGEFLPELQEGHFIVQMAMAPGTSSSESMRLGREVSRQLLAHRHVQSVSIQVGRAELGEDTAGTEFSELIVALKPIADEEEGEAVRAELRGILAAIPGARFAVLPFLEERIEETIAGTRAEVAIRIYGDDLDVLEATASEVERAVAGVRGSTDVRFHRSEEPRLNVRLRSDRLTWLGFRPLEVLEAVQTAFQGRAVAQVHDAPGVFDVVVILDDAARREPEGIAALIVHGISGARAPLRELADVFLTTGRHAVLHDGARRYQEVSCNVQGRDLDSFVGEARERIAAAVKFPPGVQVELTGAAQANAEARREILIHSLLAAGGIILLLALAFRRLSNLLLVLANLPFSLVGGVLAVLLGGGWLSLGSLVGFVTLFGITTRNSIMLISHYEHLVAVEGLAWDRETALRGASERLAPVLMTAAVTALGLLPLALGSGQAGREIEGPMAIVILGGLATSTVLTLLVLPPLALRYGRFGRPSPAIDRLTS